MLCLPFAADEKSPLRALKILCLDIKNRISRKIYSIFFEEYGDIEYHDKMK